MNGAVPCCCGTSSGTKPLEKAGASPRFPKGKKLDGWLLGVQVRWISMFVLPEGFDEDEDSVLGRFDSIFLGGGFNWVELIVFGGGKLTFSSFSIP